MKQIIGGAERLLHTFAAGMKRPRTATGRSLPRLASPLTILQMHWLLRMKLLLPPPDLGRTGSHLWRGRPSCAVAPDLVLLSLLSGLCGRATFAHSHAGLATYHHLPTAPDCAGNHLPLW